VDIRCSRPRAAPIRPRFKVFPATPIVSRITFREDLRTSSGRSSLRCVEGPPRACPSTRPPALRCARKTGPAQDERNQPNTWPDLVRRRHTILVGWMFLARCPRGAASGTIIHQWTDPRPPRGRLGAGEDRRRGLPAFRREDAWLEARIAPGRARRVGAAEERCQRVLGEVLRGEPHRRPIPGSRLKGLQPTERGPPFGGPPSRSRKTRLAARALRRPGSSTSPCNPRLRRARELGRGGMAFV